jgi:hypothetical protein
VVRKAYPEGIAIPLYAVVIREDTPFVYVQNGGKAHRRDVRLGAFVTRTDPKTGTPLQYIHVPEGLSGGEELIIMGHRAVEDGAPVRVVRRIDLVGSEAPPPVEPKLDKAPGGKPGTRAAPTTEPKGASPKGASPKTRAPKDAAPKAASPGSTGSIKR